VRAAQASRLNHWEPRGDGGYHNYVTGEHVEEAPSEFTLDVA